MTGRPLLNRDPVTPFDCVRWLAIADGEAALPQS